MMQNILDSLFRLPPPDQRTVPAWFKRRFAPMIGGQTRYDNIFIYYLVLRTSYFVGLALSLLNVLSLTLHMRLNFYLFAIDLRSGSVVKTFLESYRFYTTPALLFLVVPYYLIVWNSNFDSMVCSSYITRGLRKVKDVSKYVFALCTVLVLIILCMYFTFGLFALPMLSGHYENSSFYFLFCCVAWPAALAAGNILFFAIAIALFFDFKTPGPQQIGT